MFEDQLEKTSDKVDQVESELQSLQQDMDGAGAAGDAGDFGPTSPDPQASGHDVETRSKIDFLAFNVDLCKSTMETLLAQQAILQTEKLNALRICPTQEARQRLISTHDLTYLEAAKLLHGMEIALDEVLTLPTGCFEGICKQLKQALQSIFVTHPKTVGATLAVGAGGGAVIGAAASKGSALGAALGGIVGAVVGFAVGLIIVAAWRFLRQPPPDRAAERQRMHKEMLSKIDSFKKKAVTPEDIVHLSSLFQAIIPEAMRAPRADDICGICLDTFAADGDFVKAPLCDQRHFVHGACHTAWVRQSGNLRCTLCRR